ncbi:MAG: ABC transporter permease, partial [Spirochaetales bacterium]
MLRYTIKRFGYMIFVFFIVSVLQFGIFKMMPGDPVALQLQDRALSMTPEQYAKAYEEQKIRMGLDKSVPEQYLTWMGNTLSGDLGRSFVYRKDVKDLIAAPIVNTVSLNMASLIMVFAISIPLGIATAVRKGSKFDSTVQVGTIIGFSMPSFVIALVMIVLFAVIWP